MPSASDERRSYAEMFRATAAAHPDKIALAFPGIEVTYAELLERAQWRAREMRVFGMRAGETFGILLPNGPEIVELILGGALFGAIGVPINIRYKAFELQHVIRDAGLVTIFTTTANDEFTNYSKLLYEALPGLEHADDTTGLQIEGFPTLRSVVLVNDGQADGLQDAATLRAMANTMPVPPVSSAPPPDAPLLIMYTSGTTSNAKGCVIGNGGLVNNCEIIAEALEVPTDDVWWDPLPMFHMGGILLMTVCFTQGATFVSLPHFDPDTAFDQWARYQPTVLYPLFPTITLTLIHHPRFKDFDTTKVRWVGNVSPVDIQNQVQAAFEPAKLVSAYGMTELNGTLAYSRLTDTVEQRTNSCGHVLPGWEIKIADPDTGDEVPVGERGELYVRGINLFGGYYNNPETTKASFTGDGYFMTGDHCSIDADGLLYFHGRLKDMLKVGGENVSALEVESFLATHPAVKLAQVVGVPDARLLEVGAAFVELVPGASITEEELIGFCKGRIASFKIPRYVRVVTEWPMSSTKVQKFRLRDQLVSEPGFAG